jgi:hypothetical protein
MEMEREWEGERRPKDRKRKVEREAPGGMEK